MRKHTRSQAAQVEQLHRRRSAYSGRRKQLSAKPPRLKARSLTTSTSALCAKCVGPSRPRIQQRAPAASAAASLRDSALEEKAAALLLLSALVHSRRTQVFSCETKGGSAETRFWDAEAAPSFAGRTPSCPVPSGDFDDAALSATFALAEAAALLR